MTKARDSIEDLKTIDANFAAKAPLASPSFTGTVTAADLNVTNGLAEINRTHSTTTAPLATLDLMATSLGDMADGFGVQTRYKIKDTAGTENVVGQLNVRRDGSDTLGRFEFHTNNTERMRIDSNGIVTKPLQPAFSACLGTSHTFAVGTTTIVFNSEIFDQNSDFNASAATFTAPVTGKYQFNISVRVDNLDQGAGYYRLRLKTSNGDYQPVILGTMDVFNADPTYYYFSMPVLADMDAGDTAYVQLQVSGGAAQAQIHASRPNANFSGYLVA